MPVRASAVVYLALRAALFVWAILVSVADDSGESMAIISPLLATAPTSLVLLLVLPGAFAMFTAVLVLAALVNAAIIGWCVRALRRDGRPDPAS